MEGSQRPESEDRTPSPHSSALVERKDKHRKRQLRNFSPAFWDTLFKVVLTPRALRELDRRNRIYRIPAPVVSQQLNTRNISRFARQGGPDLGHLRGFAGGSDMTAGSLILPSDKQMPPHDSSERISAYDPNFEQHLAQNGVYMNGQRSSPTDLGTVTAKLHEERPSVSVPGAYQRNFEEFQAKNMATIFESHVMREVVPIMCGKTTIPHEEDVLFTEHQAFANDTTVRPKPDFFDGSRLADINQNARENPAMKAVIPTKHPRVPVAPNFFLEAKGLSGDAQVVMRQAAFDGAHGARAMHTLQNLNNREPQYNGRVCAFSATYSPNPPVLTLNTHHVAAPQTEGGRPEYHTNLVKFWGMSDVEQFTNGITAFRNARDMAAQLRDEGIQAANMSTMQDGGVKKGGPESS